MSRFLPAILALLALVSSAFAAPNQNPITYSITLASWSHNAAANTTTFAYTVTSNPGGGPAISHWVLGLTGDCAGSAAIKSSNDALTSWINSDPTTGLRGVKFDTGYADRETRTVTLTLAGNWNVGSVTIAVKSGNGFVNGTVQGPICGAVTPPATYSITGVVFFDANYSGGPNADEPGLGGFTVQLVTAANTPVATTTTSSNGQYAFSNVVPGTYHVLVSHAVPALWATTLTEHEVVVANADIVAPVTGYAIHFPSLGGMVANGSTIGFWKNNLEKAAAGKTNGVQLSATTLTGYTASVRTLVPLAPFSEITTLSSAASILSANGPAPTTLLAKQLLASEYNYLNGAHLNGNATLTYLFLYQGEYVLKNAATYGSDYILNLKNWFDAYNNTHGGALIGPVAP